MRATQDVEGARKEDSSLEVYGVDYVSDGNAVHRQEFTSGESMYAKLQRFAGRFAWSSAA